MQRTYKIECTDIADIQAELQKLITSGKTIDAMHVFRVSSETEMMEETHFPYTLLVVCHEVPKQGVLHHA